MNNSLLSRLRRAVIASIPFENVRTDLRQAKAHLVQALRLFWMEIFARRPATVPDAEVRLNIGCGKLVRAGWLNLDSTPSAGALYVDVINGLPLADGTVSHIHCEHFLEHLDLDSAIRFLGECFRVLKPGGTLRLIVPDAEKYLMAYANGDSEFFEKLRFLGGDPVPMQTPIEVVNRMFRMWGAHKFAWDFHLLEKALRAAGFSRVSRSKIGDVTPDLMIDGSDSWRALESLYVNAVK